MEAASWHTSAAAGQHLPHMLLHVAFGSAGLVKQHPDRAGAWGCWQQGSPLCRYTLVFLSWQNKGSLLFEAKLFSHRTVPPLSPGIDSFLSYTMKQQETY